MHFAVVGDEPRAVPAKGLKGACPSCGGAMIAKCGEQKIHHWAHQGLRSCDAWWEPETIWHRSWKDMFPKEWQEHIARDEGGEKHIADVRTEHGVVVEFQHSHLAPDERRAREAFYKSLVWVVNGTRLKRDFPRFEEASKTFAKTEFRSVRIVQFPEECFRKAWLDSPVPVLFDFRESSDDAVLPADKTRELLWCLLPGRVHGRAAVAMLTRSYFVTAMRTRSRLLDHLEILRRCEEQVRLQREQELAEWGAWFIGSVRAKRGTGRHRRF